MDGPETPLANPEASWERSAHIDSVGLDEVTRRLGAYDGPVRVLSGGQANLNVLLSDDRVLRIYRRDTATLEKEARLLRRGWCQLLTPRILDEGADWLLLEYVHHSPLCDTPASGRQVGAALAEIHSVRYAQSGFLSANLELREPMPDLVQALRAHVVDELQRHVPEAWAHLGEPVVSHLDAHAETLAEVAKAPVLLHGDFKTSNLHQASSGQLLVLDWEFAYAGPGLMDVGQLLRWNPSRSFRDAFAEAYRASGGVLGNDWERLAGVLDLVNLVGLLRRAAPGSRRGADLSARIEQTLGT